MSVVPPDQNITLEDLEDRAASQRDEVSAAQKSVDSTHGDERIAAIEKYKDATAALAVTSRWIDWKHEEMRSKSA